MNIIKVELRKYKVQTLIWTIALIAFVLVALTEYKAFEVSGDAIKQFMDAFPPILKTVFGMNNLDLAQFGGYYSMILLYGLVMISLHGLYLGINLSSSDQQSKIGDFILTKPLKRNHLMNMKLISGVLIVLIIEILLLVAQLFFVEKVNYPFLINSFIVLLSTHLLMLGFGFFCGQVSLSKGDRIGLTVVMFFYFYPVIMDLLNSSLRKLSLYSWFNEFNLENPAPLFYGICFIFVVIGYIFFVISKGLFEKKDIH